MGRRTRLKSYNDATMISLFPCPIICPSTRLEPDPPLTNNRRAFRCSRNSSFKLTRFILSRVDRGLGRTIDRRLGDGEQSRSQRRYIRGRWTIGRRASLSLARKDCCLPIAQSVPLASVKVALPLLAVVHIASKNLMVDRPSLRGPEQNRYHRLRRRRGPRCWS